MPRIVAFTDLDAWKEGHKLALAVYDATKTFPASEQFGLTSQLRRAAVSVPSNLAEGFNRFSTKEKIQFYSIALGSVSEVQSQILIAVDLGYISGEKLLKQAESTRKLINGLIRSIRNA